MGKQKAQRRVAADSAKAVASAIRSSARKLNLVAQMIRGQKAADAVTTLTFEKRRVANEVKKVLQAAIANAENNHQLDVDKLVVAEASVGRAFVMKRFHARGRGRSAGIEKPFSKLTVVVREQENEAPKRTKKPAAKSAKAPKAKAATPKAGE